MELAPLGLDQLQATVSIGHGDPGAEVSHDLTWLLSLALAVLWRTGDRGGEARQGLPQGSRSACEPSLRFIGPTLFTTHTAAHPQTLSVPLTTPRLGLLLIPSLLLAPAPHLCSHRRNWLLSS